METSKVHFKIEEAVGTIKLNNPGKMNCLDMEMLGLIEKHLLNIKNEKSVRTLIVTGAGEKAFSTGGNLKEFDKLTDYQEVRDWIAYGNEVFNSLENLPIATIAAVNGYAMGGGLELALSCDLRIASENAIFAMPELNHGWVPGWGGLARLRRLVGEGKAKEIIMLGERIDAIEAHQLGLVNKICAQDELNKLVIELAQKLSKIDPFIIEMTKLSIMDHNRSTSANDLLFDVLATKYSKKKG